MISFLSIMTERRCKYTNFSNNFQIWIYKYDYFSDKLYIGIILNKSMLIVMDIAIWYLCIYKFLQHRILYIFEKSCWIFRKCREFYIVKIYIYIYIIRIYQWQLTYFCLVLFHYINYLKNNHLYRWIFGSYSKNWYICNIFQSWSTEKDIKWKS